MQQSINSLSFAEKVKIFSHDYLKCCIYISKSNGTEYVFSKMLYSKLISSSQLLEDFLDFHGAKNNKNWYFYRELSAAVRHLSTGSYSQKHILNRLFFYRLKDSDNFQNEGKATLAFLTQSIKNMAPVIIEEAKRLNIPLPQEIFITADFPSITICDMLDYDIDDKDQDQQKKYIVKVASEFIRISRTFDQFGIYKSHDMEQIRSIVPGKINEVEIRRFEMLVHNLQSSFDTYVIHGGLRFANKELKEFRGFFSVVFHLLQMLGRFLHFYERHLHEAGYKNTYKKVQDRLASLVNPEILLDRTINYGLYYVCHFLTSGKNLASTILNKNIERSSITVGIPDGVGFHIRPSLLIAKIVQHYGGQVEMCVSNSKFDASSVLDMQWAGGKIQKEQITEVIFEGDIRALKDIEVLANINYGEDTMGKGIPFPNELKYLR